MAGCWIASARGCGLTVSVVFYSVIQMLTTTVKGLGSFCSFRFLLACGEAANNPGSTKAVSEWFPDKERAWAVALFDSGSCIGAAVAPFLVLWVYHHLGDWRPVFLVTGSMGVAVAHRVAVLYRKPEEHPRLAPQRTGAHPARALQRRSGGRRAPAGQVAKLVPVSPNLGHPAGPVPD